MLVLRRDYYKSNERLKQKVKQILRGGAVVQAPETLL